MLFIVLSRRRSFSAIFTVWCITWVAMPLQFTTVFANPTGGSVQSGSANISTGPGGVTVRQSSDRAVVNWGGFSINKGETTTFVQPGSKSAVLNRVTGGTASHLNGNLN
ncbi:MAG TPA: filamentous hemagglutinin N-terminal domain-containing protein, partial [Roseimicrobium sp.]|nr:filamentous hemagglutinin N-terminal domain-containing protein [Roseimicrobium sp.]